MDDRAIRGVSRETRDAELDNLRSAAQRGLLSRQPLHTRRYTGDHRSIFRKRYAEMITRVSPVRDSVGAVIPATLRVQQVLVAGLGAGGRYQAGQGQHPDRCT